MKAETLLASTAMALAGVIFAVLAANAMAPPGKGAAAPPRKTSAPAPPPAQSGVVLPTHTPAEATAVANLPADLRARDDRRIGDLLALQAALKLYKDRKGSYPTTGASIQTACVYEKLDKACDLKTVAANLNFMDPRGPNFGYYYASDGKTYGLYALLEGDNSASDPCPGDISVFKNPAGLFCKTPASASD